MDQDFIKAVKQMTDEQGKAVLMNGRWRSYLSDYLRNQYPKEGRLLKMILEADCAKYINEAVNILDVKDKLVKRLEDDPGIAPKQSAEYLDLLGLILKGDTSKCGKIPEEISPEEAAAIKFVSEGGDLSKIPEHLRTEKVYIQMLKRNGNRSASSRPIERFMLKDVPENFRTNELCLAAVESSSFIYDDEEYSYGYSFVRVLQYVPEYLKTAEFYLEAVKRNRYAFKYVPENLKTMEMCLEAVKRNGLAFEYVPEKFKTEEFYLEAVKKGCGGICYEDGETMAANPGYLLRYVPEEYKTLELYLEAVKRDGNALQYVPEKFTTMELCFEAVKRDADALQYVPDYLKTAELCYEAEKNIANNTWT